MCKKRLDARDTFPSGMEEYLNAYGWHFSKKLAEYAASRMKRANPATGKEESLQVWDKSKTEELLKKYGIDTSEYIGYDHVYVINMARADFYGTSIADEMHLALFVKDYLTDVDGYDEIALTRYYADCIGSGQPIPWEDVI